MILSIDNFKSIEHVAGLDISDLSVFAGVNSSGKSSVIQALLLLKQTLNSSTSEILNINGPYVYANSLLDLIHNKKGGTIGFALILNEKELNNTAIQHYAKDSVKGVDRMSLSVSFKVKSDGTFVVSEFKLSIALSNGGNIDNTLSWRPNKKVYDFKEDGKAMNGLEADRYSFVNFFPVFLKKDGNSFELPIMKAARETLVSVLENVTYIAPLRVAPVLARSYQTDIESQYVLPDGENTRFILDRISHDDKEAFALVKEWICNRFHLAHEIDVVKEPGKLYRVVVTTNERVKVDLMHMGFGLSQILPIVTQGSISKAGDLMIVEDPEVHMHPSIQASMADFFIYLCKEKQVNVMVETHSDHFITRLRRRIAEKVISPAMVNLVFVEHEEGCSEYQTISMSDTGRIEGGMPKGFMDSLDNDFRAIILANRK
ncbi:MAG: AAA family ATPase [Muribaculaceae bacterium]|nr:AAA family ATPase [Muribaculaceae bacterium]MDE6786698.1 AAA family ATPase [Muribaculaceae bacterium]